MNHHNLFLPPKTCSTIIQTIREIRITSAASAFQTSDIMKFVFLFSILFLFNLGNSTHSNTLAGNNSADGTTMTSKFKVFGNCGMCEKRIEKAAKIDGVSVADWDVDTKILTITFDEKVVKPRMVHQAVAAVGHDTELVRADDAVYAQLHACCQYERAN